jgi:hypothetical protein
MDMTQDWSVAEWQLDPPFAEAVRHVHSPLCGDHPRVVVGSTILMSQWRPFSGQAGKLGFGERIFTS